jgi:hypothetical protein
LLLNDNADMANAPETLDCRLLDVTSLDREAQGDYPPIAGIRAFGRAPNTTMPCAFWRAHSSAGHPLITPGQTPAADHRREFEGEAFRSPQLLSNVRRCTRARIGQAAMTVSGLESTNRR